MHLPLVTRSLPKYTGSSAVGLIDLEVPIAKQTIGDFKRKGEEQAGFLLETVKFSVFYPTNAKKGSNPSWMPDFGQTVNGYLVFGKKSDSYFARTLTYPFAWSLFGGTTIPAFKNAPLAEAPSGSKHPVIFFSHGLAGNRFLYSAFCGEMASRGYIVAAVESRDGSGPSTTIKSADGSTKKIDYIQSDDLEWTDGNNSDPMRLRHMQLEVRRAEFKELLSIFQRLQSGANDIPQPASATSFDWSTWRNMDASRPIMAGHSFGGATALSCAEKIDTFSRTVVLDPWVEPLSASAIKTASPLVINSEDFTVWFASFTRLRGLVKKAGGSLYTIAGASHHSFSDFPLLLPDYLNKKMNLSTPAAEVMKHIVDLTTAFLNNTSPTNVTQSSETKFSRPIAKPGTVLQHEV